MTAYPIYMTAYPICTLLTSGILGTCTPGICAADAHLPVTTSTTTTLKIAQVNLNGLGAKLHSLHSFIILENLKVICVTESHLLAHMSGSFVDIPSYKLLRSDSDGYTRKHGVCVPMFTIVFSLIVLPPTDQTFCPFA